MRIVSQDRKYNLAFDQVHISTGRDIDGYTIVARDSFWNRPITLAEYSTDEKCQYVFWSIVNRCSSGLMNVFILPKDEEVNDSK